MRNAFILLPIALLTASTVFAASKKSAFPASAPIAVDSAGAGALPPAKMGETAADRVWVKISDGAIACADPKAARAALESQRLLEAEKIRVFEAKVMNDGKMRAQVCGIPKGVEHHFLILKKDLPRAEKKGFQLDPEGASLSPSEDAKR